MLPACNQPAPQWPARGAAVVKGAAVPPTGRLQM